jgi:hypothetical protein
MVIEQAPSRVINVHRLALMMNKPIGIAGRNPTWPRRFNEVVKFEDSDEEEVTKSLPPRPRVARLMPSNPAAPPTAAASLNAYEYYWRAKPAAQQQPPAPPAATKNNPNKLIISRNIIPAANDQQQSLVLTRGGCKEPRRSLLFWEPYCIAT